MTLDPLTALYAGGTAQRLYDESVTELAHGLQAAQLASRAGAPDTLVAAALLHDVGHLVAEDLHHIDVELDGDAEHEAVGARYLRRWFPAAVTAPVALHVAAKRYLCATDVGYAARLSPSSIRSLEVQGGPLRGDEVRAFEARPFADAAVQLRRWDDAAKVAGAATATFADYRPLLESLTTPTG